MKTEYKYIKMVQIPSYRKTKVFAVQNLKYGSPLGIIEYQSSWRQYCFYPNRETIFSAGCLADIQDFIKQLMEEKRK